MVVEIAFVVNPVAGHGSGLRAWRELKPRLTAAGLPHTVSFTAGRGEATALTRKALQEGVRTIGAVGGDGTASEVVNGFFERGRPVAPGARFAFVTAGTGNDTGRQFQLADPVRLDGPTITIDVLHLSYQRSNGGDFERYALIHAGVGLATEAVEMSDRIRTRFAWLAYAGGTAAALYRHRPRMVRYSCDGGPTVSRDLSLFFAANGTYAGGGMQVAPMAAMDDGVMDIITIEGASRRAMMFRLLPAVYRGAHIGHPAVGHQQARTLDLDAESPLSVEVDGEIVGKTPVRIDLLPRALVVCAQRQM